MKRQILQYFQWKVVISLKSEYFFHTVHYWAGHLPVNEASDKSSSIINGILFFNLLKICTIQITGNFNLDMDDSWYPDVAKVAAKAPAVGCWQKQVHQLI